MSEAPVVQVKDLQKTFRLGFLRKRVEAVRGVSFEVHRGETFGLLGPNGAGKTTTLKMVLRLIFPDSGQIRLFDTDLRSPRDLRRVGYLPENPYVYQYLKPFEFLDLCGRLVGLSAAERKRRSQELIEQVGLSDATDRPIGRFSKGMMQRIGLAQALLHDPELLILDEPMSGLDPIGRKQVRDVIMQQRKRGKTLIFTSHILSDVERLCDHVAIVRQGKVVDAGALQSLLRKEAERVELELGCVEASARRLLEARAVSLREHEGRTHALLEGADGLDELLQALMAENVKILAVQPQRETLEDLFVRHAMGGSQDRAKAQDGPDRQDSA